MISRRSKTKWFLCFGFGLWVSGACTTPKQTTQTTPERTNYNILMIAIDDMNDWVGALGGQAITPNIDRLARQGRLFTNAHTVVPACNPSRTALLTGQRPETTGQYENEGNFREKPGGEQRVTLPQYLLQNGYKTYAAGKIFHQPRGGGKSPSVLSDTVSWTDQHIGYVGTEGHKNYLNEDNLASWLGDDAKPYMKTNEQGGVNYMFKFGVWGPITDTREETGDWKSAQYCVKFLQSTANTHPFLLSCGIFRPHSPQLAPQRYFDMYPLDKVKVPELPVDDMNDVPEVGKTNWSTPFVKLVQQKGELQKAVQGYLASMTFADDCVGQVLDALDKSPYKNNTIVVLWTDHGFQLAHKDRWEKYSLWRQATHVPFIIRYPAMPNPGTSCQEAVSLLDVYPTICDLIGLPKPKTLEGESLLPWLTKPNLPKKTPAIITYPKDDRAVQWKQWRYIKYAKGDVELYDHSKDPGEYANLAGQTKYRKVVQKLDKMLTPLEQNQ